MTVLTVAKRQKPERNFELRVEPHFLRVAIREEPHNNASKNLLSNRLRSRQRLGARSARPACCSSVVVRPTFSERIVPMTNQTIAMRRKPECKLACDVERRPHFLLVTIKGEATFDQAEFISAHLLRIPVEAYSLVVLNLAEMTFISSLAMGALVSYRRDVGRRGVEVRLANVQAPVWLALESAGLCRVRACSGWN